MVYIREDFLSPKECDEIRALFPATGQGALVGSGVVNEKRRSRTAFLPHDTPAQKNVYERLLAASLRANVALGLHFDIDDVEAPQLAEYAVDDKYDWHLDYGPSNARLRKLSVSVQLSSPTDYDGGELEFRASGVAPKEQGALVVFPSFLGHRVLPVTRGIRYSLVAWAIGKLPYR